MTALIHFPRERSNLVILWIAQPVEMCECIGLNISHLILQTPTLKANMIQFDGLIHNLRSRNV